MRQIQCGCQGVKNSATEQTDLRHLQNSQGIQLRVQGAYGEAEIIPDRMGMCDKPNAQQADAEIIRFPGKSRVGFWEGRVASRSYKGTCPGEFG